ncbi:MAG TPA: hypothetical protein VG142_03800 [Trebonia sp.]|jgi:hypothetical protein|nr:hypothetical protein [Trebonia sp.]
MKIVIAAGFAALCLSGIGAAVPRVLAAERSAPVSTAASASAPAGSGVPAGWPAGKAAAMTAENQLREASAGRPVVAPDGAGTERQAAAVAPQAAYTAGILPVTDGGPFDSSQFVGTNAWNGPVGGRWEVVQAGGAPADRALGAASPASAGLFVYTEPADPAATAGRRVSGILEPSPDPPGTFTVAKATGTTLTLALSGSRTLYYFDVLTRKFTR